MSLQAAAPSPSSPIRRFEIIFLLCAGLVSSVWCVTAARRLSATFDEPTYLQEGLTRWRSGSMAGMMRLGTMPLPVDVQTLPLYLWERWQGTPINLDTHFDQALAWARGFNLVFWWLLLVYVWLSARALGGPWAGVIAVAFLSCEPEMMSHAGLALTDIAVTAFLVALLYHFQRNRDQRWLWRIAWPGFWFGLALLAKASGLVFGGLCLFALEGCRCSWWRSRDGQPAHRFRASFRDLVQIGLIGLALTFVYCGSDWRQESTFVNWARSLPEGPFASLLVWVAEHLRIFSNAGVGIARQFTHNLRGHGSFLLGESHPRALWYYFPVLLTIKLTVPLLLGTLVLGVRYFSPLPGPRGRRVGGEGEEGSRPPHPQPLSPGSAGERGGRGRSVNWPLQAALALLLFSPFCRVQIGIRFMFPLIALLVVGVSVLLVEAVREAPSVFRRRLLTWGSAGGLAWSLASLISVWPHGMCYVNPLWGGTGEGYRLVSEGNYDWGQGLKELVAWQKIHHVPDLDAWMFSTDPLTARAPLRPVFFHQVPIRNEEEFLDMLRGRHLAVSVTFLHGVASGPNSETIRHVLFSRQPVARTTMYHIYDFTDVKSVTQTAGR